MAGGSPAFCRIFWPRSSRSSAEAIAVGAGVLPHDRVVVRPARVLVPDTAVSRWLVMPSAARSLAVRFAWRRPLWMTELVAPRSRSGRARPSRLGHDLGVLELVLGDLVAAVVEDHEPAGGRALVDGADVRGPLVLSAMSWIPFSASRGTGLRACGKGVSRPCGRDPRARSPPGRAGAVRRGPCRGRPDEPTEDGRDDRDPEVEGPPGSRMAVEYPVTNDARRGPKSRAGLIA